MVNPIRNLDWQYCEGSVLCRLMNLNVSRIVDGVGVYVIWRQENRNGAVVPVVVYVGQGMIKERLASHKGDGTFEHQQRIGILYVSWALVPWNGTGMELSGFLLRR